MIDEVSEIRAWLDETIDRMLAAAAELSDDELHWKPESPNTNSVAVLLTHTMGSIEETIVQVLSGSPVGRDRDAEFVESTITAAALADQWSAQKVRLDPVFEAIDVEQLRAIHPHPRRGEATGRNVIVGALAHAREHLGHVELIRDLIHARRG